MVKIFTTDQLGRFFVKGFTEAAEKLRHFDSQICLKLVFVLTTGPYEVPSFSRATISRRIEPWGSTVLVGGPLILRAISFQMMNLAFIARRPSGLQEGSRIVNTCSQRTCCFTRVDSKIAMQLRVFSLMEVFRLRCSYELLEWLCSQFMPTASRVGVDVARSQEAVLSCSGRKT